MEDIKKAIEEEAKDFANKLRPEGASVDAPTVQRGYWDHARYGYIKGYNDCLSAWQESERWRKVEEELPSLGEEVLFFHEDWIDEDFNPKGIKIGFRLDEDYVTAHYWSHQDCYMTISHSECDDNPEFSDKTRASIKPQKWKPIH